MQEKAPEEMPEEMLQVNNLKAGYAVGNCILDGITFSLSAAQTLCVLGRNGAGRSTLAKALMGLLPWQTGSILFQKTQLQGLPSHQIARQGIGYVPEGRDVFTHLTVAENLMLGQIRTKMKRQKTMQSAQLLDAAYSLFPELETRKNTPAAVLSGGEQQMLSIARALQGQPTCLVLDEMSEGLAPVVLERIAHALKHLQQQGVAMLLIEQNLAFVQNLEQNPASAIQTLVLGKGRVVFEGDMNTLLANENIQRTWLDV